MNNIQVKPVDVLGDTIIAARIGKEQVWAGVSYFCKALGMSNAQRDAQVEKVQSDRTLKRGTRKFPGGVFDPNNETVAIKIDFIPLWLAKIQITKKMEKEHPELADKLLEYQLKAKDILAEAFMPKQIKLPTEPMELLELHYQALKKVDRKVETLEERFNKFEQELPMLPDDADEVHDYLNKRVVFLLGGKESNAYRNKSLSKKVFMDAYRVLKYNFNVSRYKAIKRSQKAQALQIISEYKPPLFLAEQISNENSQQTLDLEGGM